MDEWATPSEKKPDMTPRIWAVGALCRAVADALQARFNPVAVRGEISGFTRASSGHCYFTLKDEQGQIRCAMFRRAAQLLDFSPQDGQQVEASGRLSIYEPRGELQIVVESLRRAGQGALFEQFLRLKAKLQEQGLFDADRKRGLPAYPKGIGLVTSLSAAALHDVITALRRRVPHLPVIVANAPVQGAQAAPALVQALQTLGRRTDVDVILLVRGGGSMEDLWAFNDERLAHAIAASPYPVVSGVGHETDFTIADFCADAICNAMRSGSIGRKVGWRGLCKWCCPHACVCKACSKVCNGRCAAMCNTASSACKTCSGAVKVRATTPSLSHARSSIAWVCAWRR